ncbi:hypothetical protein D9M70_629500 [compost metagenome]
MLAYGPDQFKMPGACVDLLPGKVHRQHDSLGFRRTCEGLSAGVAPVRFYVGDDGGFTLVDVLTVANVVDQAGLAAYRAFHGQCP